MLRNNCREGELCWKAIRAIARLLVAPSLSYWLKDALRTAIERDHLDALNDAEARSLINSWQQVKPQSSYIPALAASRATSVSST